jgi:ATP-dependent DNA helicase RecG
MRVSELMKLLAEGESQHVEFEKSVGSDTLAKICSFANADGGTMLIGVDDNGEVVGCDVKRSLSSISAGVQNITPPPDLAFDRVRIDGKDVLVVKIARSEHLCSIGGLSYIRIGTSKRPLSVQEIFSLGVELGEVGWDRIPTRIESTQANREYLELYFEKIKKRRGEAPADWRKYLLTVGAFARKGGKIYLTNAGLLFFMENPQDFLPASGARIIWVSAGGEPVKHQEFFGPVWKLADEIVETLEKETGKREVVVGARREVIPEYPMRAVREAVINALIHRNYAIQADVRIFLHPDKLVVRSPGGLLPSVDLNDPDHVPRNPALCQMMFDMGYVEKYGFGIRLMKNEAASHPIVSLSLKPASGRFDVVFEQNKPLELLDDTSRKILSLCAEGPKSSGELARAIGLSKPAVVARLKKLIAAGLVQTRGRGPAARYFKS